MIDLTGRRVGRLVVRRRAERTASNGEGYWVCRCSCGWVWEVRGDYLRSGQIGNCRRCGAQRSGETRRVMRQAAS